MKLSCLTVVLFSSLAFAQINEPPNVSGSYKAMGELVTTVDETIINVAFEENFDADTQNAAFSVWQTGLYATFVENGATNETIEYLNNQNCTVINKTDWINIDSPPSLMGYGSSTGKIYFSLKQLFSLSSQRIVDVQENATFRNIPARLWTYEMQGTDDAGPATINVYAYWSAPNWTTSSKSESSPLGYEITKLIVHQGEKVRSYSQYVSVFGFLNDTFDRNAFAPQEGIYCADRSESRLPLPRFSGIQSISLRSETIHPFNRDIKTMDAYYDISDGLLRIDLNRLDNQEVDVDKSRQMRTYTSQITSRVLDATFRLVANKYGMTCSVLPIDNYTFDDQEIINPKLALQDWKFHSILGNSSYIYLGMTHKRNIPCHVYQGVRQDWPEPLAGVTSLWEWCFSVKMTSDDEFVRFKNNNTGLVGASVKILKSTHPDFPVDFNLIHHFYDVVNETAENLVYSNFDISRCFGNDQKYFLEFLIDVQITDDNKDALHTATSDITFLTQWRNAVIEAAKLKLTDLRVSNLQAFIYNNKFIVDFLLLGLHNDLPAQAKKGKPSLEVAYKSISDAINSDRLNITYFYPNIDQILSLKARKNSIRKVYDRTYEYNPVTIPPISSTTESTTATTPFTIIVETTTATGQTTGQPTGETTGESTGETTGESTGETTGETTGQTTGEPTGQPTGLPTGQPTGLPTGQPTGLPTGPPTVQVDIYDGHRPGTVAGVSIALFLVGITIGAGGTYYKLQGLPNFRR